MIKIPGAFEQPRHYLFIPSRAKIPPSLLLTPGAASKRQFLGGCRRIFLHPLSARLLLSVYAKSATLFGAYLPQAKSHID